MPKYQGEKHNRENSKRSFGGHAEAVGIMLNANLAVLDKRLDNDQHPSDPSGKAPLCGFLLFERIGVRVGLQT